VKATRWFEKNEAERTGGSGTQGRKKKKQKRQKKGRSLERRIVFWKASKKKIKILVITNYYRHININY